MSESRGCSPAPGSACSRSGPAPCSRSSGPRASASRALAQEFLAEIDATVVSARCLSYGEGITYWPAVEIVKQLLGTEPADDPAIDALLGHGQAATDEIAFGVRKLLEAQAAARPLIVLLDDLHWGEPAFLDLVEQVADLSRDAPILLVCLARPELLDRRPGWSGGKLNATSVLLEPLADDETDELIDGLLDGHPLDIGLRRRIAVAAEGNPLFVEEMLAMVHERGPDEVSVPPTIQALLAARLDQLPRPERATLERGAVEGQVFHRGAVEALAARGRRTSERICWDSYARSSFVPARRRWPATTPSASGIC